jgi:hypothetical protein
MWVHNNSRDSFALLVLLVRMFPWACSCLSVRHPYGAAAGAIVDSLASALCGLRAGSPNLLSWVAARRICSRSLRESILMCWRCKLFVANFSHLGRSGSARGCVGQLVFPEPLVVVTKWDCTALRVSEIYATARSVVCFHLLTKLPVAQQLLQPHAFCGTPRSHLHEPRGAERSGDQDTRILGCLVHDRVYKIPERNLIRQRPRTPYR